MHLEMHSWKKPIESSLQSQWMRSCRVIVKIKVVTGIDWSLFMHNGVHHNDTLVLLSRCQRRPLQFLQAVISVLTPPVQSGVIFTLNPSSSSTLNRL